MRALAQHGMAAVQYNASHRVAVRMHCGAAQSGKDGASLPPRARVGREKGPALLRTPHAQRRDWAASCGDDEGDLGSLRARPAAGGSLLQALPGLQKRSSNGRGWWLQEQERRLPLRPGFHLPLCRAVVCTSLSLAAGYLQPFGWGKCYCVLTWALTFTAVGNGMLASVHSRYASCQPWPQACKRSAASWAWSRTCRRQRTPPRCLPEGIQAQLRGLGTCPSAFPVKLGPLKGMEQGKEAAPARPCVAVGGGQQGPLLPQ